MAPNMILLMFSPDITGLPANTAATLSPPHRLTDFTPRHKAVAPNAKSRARKRGVEASWLSFFTRA